MADGTNLSAQKRLTPLCPNYTLYVISYTLFTRTAFQHAILFVVNRETKRRIHGTTCALNGHV